MQNSHYSVSVPVKALSSSRVKMFLGYLVVLAIWLCSAGFFSYFFSNHYEPNGVMYALEIETSGPEFSPHHMLYQWVGAGMFGLLTAFGWQGNVLIALQLVNVMAGATGLCLLYLLLKRATGDIDISLIPVIGLAFSAGYLFYAVDAQVQILPIPVALLTLIALMKYGQQCSIPEKMVWAFVLALLSSLTILMFQPFIFLLVVVAVGMLVDIPLASVRSRLLPIIVFGLLSTIIIGGFYTSVGVLSGQVHNFLDLWLWITSQAQLGMFVGGQVSQMVLAWYGLAKTVVIYPWLRELAATLPSITDVRATLYLAQSTRFQQLFFTLFYILTFCLVILPVAYALTYRQQLRKRYGNLLIALFVWLVLFGGFVTWYIATSIEGWLIPLVGIWIIWGLVLSNIKAGGTLHHRWPWVVGATILALVMIIVINVPFLYLSKPLETNEDYTEAMLVKQLTELGDLIVTFGEGYPYIPYFAQRQTFVIVYEYHNYGQNRAETYHALEEEARQTWAAGNRVYLVEDENYNAWYEAWMYRVGFSHEDLDHLDRRLVSEVDGFKIWEIIP